MAALDVGAAPLLRRVLRRVLADRAAIVVTHDVLDALLLASRVLVLDQGRIVESGPTAEVIDDPRTPFTARIAGLNLVRGTATGSGVRDPDGLLVEGSARVDTDPGSPAVAVFGPTAVAVYDRLPHGSPRNTFPVTVTELEPRDAQVRVRAPTAVAARCWPTSRLPRWGSSTSLPRQTGFLLRGQGQRGRDLPLLTAGAYAVLMPSDFAARSPESLPWPWCSPAHRSQRTPAAASGSPPWARRSPRLAKWL